MPIRISKQEFGRRLQHAMHEKGWTQSELARQANVSRDAVSTYIRGVFYPSASNLRQLARALDTTPEAFLPDYAKQTIEDKHHPSIGIEVLQNVTSLKIDCRVTLKTALAVGRLLDEDELLGGVST